MTESQLKLELNNLRVLTDRIEFNEKLLSNSRLPQHLIPIYKGQIEKWQKEIAATLYTLKRTCQDTGVFKRPVVDLNLYRICKHV